MKKTLLYLVTSVLVLLLGTKPYSAKASHVAGGELVYEWVSDSTYRFIFKFYRDCSGIAEQATQDLCVFNPCTGNGFTVTMNKWPGLLPGGAANGTKLAMGCSAYKTKCDSAASLYNGFREWWYSANVVLPSRCSSWRFSVDISARNTSNNLPSGNFYAQATLDNTGNRQGNSSPYFSIKPMAYACQNMPTTYNNGAIDPDGDSLVTEVMNPLEGGIGCSNVSAPNVTFTTASPAFSIPNNPIQTNNTFTTNAANGQMSFTPTDQGISVLDVRVKEYRNGVLIGTVMREMMIQVMPCSVSTPTATAPAGAVTGGNYNGTQVQGCIGVPLSFSFYAKAPVSTSVLKLSDNHAISIPGATVTYTNQGKDSVRGTFSWTANAANTGLKNLVVTMLDSSCTPPGILLYYTKIIPIYIWPKTTIVSFDTSICLGDTAHLQATNGGNYTWTILPGGSAGSLSCTNCTNTLATPTVATQYVVTSALNSYCPNSNKDTMGVTLKGTSPPGLYLFTTTPMPWLGLNVTFTATPVNCSSPNNYFQWYRNGNVIQGANSNTWSTTDVRKTEVISCVMICNSNCASPKIAADSMSIHVFASVDDVNNASNISIYPNPNTGSFTITADVVSANSNAVPVEIYNAVGQLVYRDAIQPANNKLNKTIQLSELPNGVYHLHLKMPDGMKSAPFSIQR